eukprot:1267751-Pyramimonas_sp.AAC.1
MHRTGPPLGEGAPANGRAFLSTIQATSLADPDQLPDRLLDCHWVVGRQDGENYDGTLSGGGRLGNVSGGAVRRLRAHDGEQDRAPPEAAGGHAE